MWLIQCTTQKSPQSWAYVTLCSATAEWVRSGRGEAVQADFACSGLSDSLKDRERGSISHTSNYLTQVNCLVNSDLAHCRFGQVEGLSVRTGLNWQTCLVPCDNFPCVLCLGWVMEERRGMSGTCVFMQISLVSKIEGKKGCPSGRSACGYAIKELPLAEAIIRSWSTF